MLDLMAIGILVRNLHAVMHAFCTKFTVQHLMIGTRSLYGTPVLLDYRGPVMDIYSMGQFVL